MKIFALHAAQPTRCTTVDEADPFRPFFLRRKTMSVDDEFQLRGANDLRDYLLPAGSAILRYALQYGARQCDWLAFTSTTLLLRHVVI